MVPDQESFSGASPEDDPYLLGRIKNYRSLMPIAMESRKPVFDLRPADGAIGARMAVVQVRRVASPRLAERVLE